MAIVEESSNTGKNENFEWKNQLQHVLFFWTYIMDWGALSLVIYEDGEIILPHNTTPLHYMIVSIFIAGPVLFLQNFIGQYTRKGCLFISEMLPLACGVGFSMIFISLIQFVIQLYYTTVLLFYLLVSIYNVIPPWMLCFDSFLQIYSNCFSRRDFDLCPTARSTDKPCFEPGTRTPAPYIFKEFVAFKRIKVDKSNPMYVFTETWFIMLFHAVHLGIVLVLLLVISRRSFKNIDLALRLTVSFCFIASLAIVVVIFTQPGSTYGLVYMMKKMNSDSFLRLDLWVATIRRTVEGLRLSEGGHILFGSFIPEADPSPLRYFWLTVFFLALIWFVTMHFYLFKGILSFKLNLNIRNLGYGTEEDAVFVVYPMVLGIQASAQLFGLIYFLVLILMSFHSLALKLMIIETTISQYLGIQEYYFYIRFAICLIGSALTFPFALPELIQSIFRCRHELRIFMIVTVAMQTIIVHLYGVQRFCDDVHFYFHSPVTAFIKACWIITPILCSLVIYEEITNDKNYHLHYIIRGIVCGGLCLPLILCFLGQLFVYSKQKNIIGIFRPTDRYGPPDIELRILRVLYNPRLSVRCKRQIEVCNHECLLNSEALKTAIYEEILLIKKTVEELESSTIDKNSHLNIVIQLEKHIELLNNFYENL